MKHILIALAAVLFMASTSSAQVVIAPSAAVFAHPDADFNITGIYHVDFFTCGSVTPAGVCTGQATAPFQAGLDVPKAQVTGPATARSIDLKTSAATGLLTSVPIGTGIVSQVKAIGDTSIPGVAGTSAASNVSNVFFSQAGDLSARWVGARAVGADQRVVAVAAVLYL